VAEELKKFTNFFDCGTPRIFEDADYKYVFRTSPTATMDSVGAALYVKEAKGSVKSIAAQPELRLGPGLLGRLRSVDEAARPRRGGQDLADAQLFAGQYNAEISSLLSAGADVIHSSFWDGDSRH